MPDATATLDQVHSTLPLDGEKLISLAAAAGMFPGYRGGSHVNSSTPFRWIVRGVKTPSGVIRLEAVEVGNRWLTSREAVGRFVAATTAASDPAAAQGARADFRPV